jgi:hypothetical protein
MSLQKIQLRKLLKLIFLLPAKQQSALRQDIRQDKIKENGGGEDARDFYVPFWSDAKLHVAGQVDLADNTAARIESNWHRKNLYPLLQKGFQSWWGEQRRFLNEPIIVQPSAPHGQFTLYELGVTIRVENVLPLEIGDHSKRIIYPYFAVEPTLTDDSARISLWVLSETLKDQNASELYILDVFRGASFSLVDQPLKGNEKARLIQMTKELIALRKKLQKK